MLKIRALQSIATIVVLALAGTGVAMAAKPSFKTGTYSGKTSQGSTFVVEIKKLGSCGRKGGLCFVTTTQPEVKTTCPNGESDEYEDVGDVTIPASGVIREKTKSSDGTSYQTVIRVSQAGTITGSFKVSGEPDSLEAPTGTCTGSATFTLKRR